MSKKIFLLFVFSAFVYALEVRWLGHPPIKKNEEVKSVLRYSVEDNFLTENKKEKTENMIIDIENGNGQVLYVEGDRIVKKEIFVNAEFNEKIVLIKNKNEVLEEVSKIKKGTQITVGYYENGQPEYVLNFENKEMILGYTLEKNGKIKEMRKGGCNNFDRYIYVENSKLLFKKGTCIYLDFTKK